MVAAFSRRRDGFRRDACTPQSQRGEDGRQVADRNGLVARSPRTNKGMFPSVLMRCFGMVVGILVLAFVAGAQTNSASDAEAQGQQLAQKILGQPPTESLTNMGVMKTRDANGGPTDYAIKFTILVTATNWSSVYEAAITNQNHVASEISLKIDHSGNRPNSYAWAAHDSINSFTIERGMPYHAWRGTEWFKPFPSSDFWAVDLGLEFLHWPDQKVIKKEFMRGRGCMVLESANPVPETNGYSRVDSWIDEETLGIVHAEAYDANGKLLKVFDPKSFKKVNGQWELQDMEIRNVQTGSRTRIEFDFGK
jgi:hypothetical protein